MELFSFIMRHPIGFYFLIGVGIFVRLLFTHTEIMYLSIQYGLDNKGPISGPLYILVVMIVFCLSWPMAFFRN